MSIFRRVPWVQLYGRRRPTYDLTTSNDRTVNANVESLTLTTVAATVSRDREVDCSVESLSLTTFTATITRIIDAGPYVPVMPMTVVRHVGRYR